MKPHYLLPVLLALSVSSCVMPRQLEKGIVTADESLVSSALAGGEDPNEVRGGMPPIIRAAATGKDRIVQILVDNGADMYQVRTIQASQVNAFPQFRWREQGEYCDSSLPCLELSYDAACAAARGGYESVLKVLRRNGLDVNKTTPHPALCAMQAERPLRMLQALNNLGITLDGLSDASLMHQAVLHREQSAPLISYLSSQGVSVEEALPEDIADRVRHWSVAEGQPPLVTAIEYSAATKENYEAIKALLDHGADRSSMLPDGNTPLSIAINANCRACIVQLISVESVLDKTVSDALPRNSLAQKLHSATVDTLTFAVGMRAFSSLSEKERTELEEDLNRRRPSSQIRISKGDYNKYFWQKNSYIDVLPKKEIAYLKEQNNTARREALQKHAAIRKREALKERSAQKKQKDADKVIDVLIDQNPEIQDALQQVADGKELCRHSSQISTGIRRFSCEYMTEGRYREYGKSESCQRAKKALSQQATSNTLSICNSTKKAEARLLDALSDDQQKIEMRQRISQSGSDKWSHETVKQYFDYPVEVLTRMRDDAKRAQESHLKENTQMAWAGFVKSLKDSSNSYSQSPAAITFKKLQQQANQVIIDHQILQAAQQQVNRMSPQNKANVATRGASAAKKQERGNRRQAVAERCEQQGGRFDATRDNCTIVTRRTTTIVQSLGTNSVMQDGATREGASSARTAGTAQNGPSALMQNGASDNSHTSNSLKGSGAGNQNGSSRSGDGASESAENGWKWTTRLDCGSTHFDDVMPEKDTVCTHAAIPRWQILWRNKPLLGGIHIAVFSIENQSDFPLKFELVGRARGDMETKSFEWNVTVPPHSTRSYPGGIAQLEEPIHNLELRKLRYREPVL